MSDLFSNDSNQSSFEQWNYDIQTKIMTYG